MHSDNNTMYRYIQKFEFKIIIISSKKINFRTYDTKSIYLSYQSSQNVLSMINLEKYFTKLCKWTETFRSLFLTLTSC